MRGEHKAREGSAFHRDARERKSRRARVSGDITRWAGTGVRTDGSGWRGGKSNVEG